MKNENELIPETYPQRRHPISWSAIFVGALVGVGLGFLLHLYALAIGLSAFNLSDDGAAVMAYGGLLGLMVGVIASTLVSGYTAGYLGRNACPERNLGILYGFTTWSVALLLSAAVAGSVSQYVASAAANLAPSLSVSTENVEEVVAVDTTTAPGAASQETVNVTTSESTLAWSAFILFVLFFLGAFFSCLGACWGMGCRRQN
ncbi:MAG: hypothetical protein JJT82_01415 [Legionellaceae bacterium]|nr:hypothetical protein [Legionellaceae bacterium]